MRPFLPAVGEANEDEDIDDAMSSVEPHMAAGFEEHVMSTYKDPQSTMAHCISQPLHLLFRSWMGVVAEVVPLGASMSALSSSGPVATASEGSHNKVPDIPGPISSSL